MVLLVLEKCLAAGEAFLSGVIFDFTKRGKKLDTPYRFGSKETPEKLHSTNNFL
jgi:hypothetical protein